MAEIRFYLDENVANDVARGLRLRGIDVLTTPEAGNIGFTDPEQLEFALKQQRVLVTQDDDFLRLARTVVEYAGMIYYKPQTLSIKQILSGLVLIHGVLTAAEMVNHIEFL